MSWLNMLKKGEVSNLCSRPPIVAVLGHVDHGKTSLLDRIRQSRVAEREAGGITQKIGAYQVEVKSEAGVVGKITFIDTPGHQAFSKMRSRGASVADLVVLVVAADDGVMPQTLESVEHARLAGTPLLVAINKSDLPSADIERVKKQLSENGIMVEGYGGDVVCVPVSAKTGQGIRDLLEMIVLMGQMREIKVDRNGRLEGVVIESRKDKTGSSGTVIVKSGTLKIGDFINIEGVSSKVRGLMDENGKRVGETEPSQPVEVLGFEVPPPVGAKVLRADGLSNQSVLSPTAHPRLPQEAERNLKIILKAETAGSLEALSAGLPQKVFVVWAGISEITESDIMLAHSTGARIFGFRVKAPKSVLELAENEKVEVKTYEIIYQLFEDLEKEVLKVFQPVPTEEILGRAEIVDEFLLGGSRIAGCRVVEGKISKDEKSRLTRGGKPLGETTITSMRQKAKIVDEAKVKEEFGAVLAPALDFKVGDVLLSFRPK